MARLKNTGRKSNLSPAKSAESPKGRGPRAQSGSGSMDLFAGFLGAAGIGKHHIRQLSPGAWANAMRRPKMRPKSKAVKRAAIPKPRAR